MKNSETVVYGYQWTCVLRNGVLNAIHWPDMGNVQTMLRERREVVIDINYPLACLVDWVLRASKNWPVALEPGM